jgi:hypothetical protein
MLMDADRRGVDHLQIAVVRLGYRVENATPHAELPPSNKAVVAGGVRAVALRNVV